MSLEKQVKEQFDVLSEGLVDLISPNEFRACLEESIKNKKPLRVKYGADPSSPDLHLGHTVPLRKLKQFQDFGHGVVFIIGDFTARIGDPTQRSETRPMLTPEQVRQNALTYQEQVFKILDKNKTEVRYNADWLEKMTPQEFLHLTAQYTVARLLERDDFQKRYRAQQPIALIEFLYPLLQGYDSVMIKSDIELGGTDQKFNLLVGRELQKIWGQKPQLVMTLPLIEGTDGTQKMSKSYGNHIAIQDSPKEMFGKVMSVPDKLVENYYRYASGLDKKDYESVLKDLFKKDPREAKARLGERIVFLYHGETAAKNAREEFDRVFRDKGLPEDIPVCHLSVPVCEIVQILEETKMVSSKSEARRLISQGGVRVDSQKVEDPKAKIDLQKEVLIQCGKRKFAKVRFRDK